MRKVILICLISLIAAMIPAGAALATINWIGNSKFLPENDGGYGGWTGISGSQNIFAGERLKFYTEMYDDYLGAHAEVCWAVNNDWVNKTCQAMNYIGNTGVPDNNSIWQSPDLYGPWNAGDYLEVYFHGWDDWGANVYDNNNGSNYRFNVIAVNTANDNNVYWTGLKHDSHGWPPDANSIDYREPPGAVPTGASITLKLRAYKNDLSAAQVEIWDKVGEGPLTGSPFALSKEATLGDFDVWSATISAPANPTILWYKFQARDGADDDYYEDEDNLGGLGQVVDTPTAGGGSFQLTVYDSNFTTPDWMKDGVVYQIFPDRFRDGDSANNPTIGDPLDDWVYGVTPWTHTTWNEPPCDPRDSGGACYNIWSADFFGGDLAGVTAQINANYFTDLGVTVLYLNPIFRSPSNHLYDTQDYFAIDPYFGDLAAFQNLISAASGKGIKVILDGVFNHTSSDSPYFDLDSRWTSNGACEYTTSTYRNWYYFPDNGAPARDNGSLVYCAPPDYPGTYNTTYEAWFGYYSLPKLNGSDSGVRNLVWNNGVSSVGPYWIGQGADGWRLDVGGDIDPGLGSEHGANDYWEGFRSAVRSQQSEAIVIGEEWGDATDWLLGNEWDSVMNYRFRSAVLDWLFDGCTGNGCSGGTSFSDNDSNAASASGAIDAAAISQFDHYLKSIQEDYPRPAWYAMMNLYGSHDTNRILFLLKKISNDDATAAKNKLKLAAILGWTYPGAPTIYYGDEAGVNPDGVWDGSTWQDDPYNRYPYPWSDQGGSPDSALLSHYQTLGAIRHTYACLRTGDLATVKTDDANQVYAYARWDASQTAIVVLNRKAAAQEIALDVGAFFEDGANVVTDVLNGNKQYNVSGGQVTIPLADTTALWGHILIGDTPTTWSESFTANTAVRHPPGAKGLTIDFPTDGDAPNANCSIDVQVYPGQTPPNGGGAVQRYFEITNNGCTGFSADLTFSYLDHELNGNAEGTLKTYRWTGSQWQEYTVVTEDRDSIGNKITARNVTDFSLWALSNNTPTAVALAAFTATPQPGAILLQWETATELDNLGFHLYRAIATDGAPDGPQTRLSGSLIPSQMPGSPGGARYEFVDRDVEPGRTYYYWLESVDVHGVAACYGPVSTTATANLFRLYLPLIR